MKKFKGWMCAVLAVSATACGKGSASREPESKPTGSSAHGLLPILAMPFEDICRNPTWLGENGKKTIDALLVIAGTSDCDAAVSNLAAVEVIDLSCRVDAETALSQDAARNGACGLTDLTPFASLARSTNGMPKLKKLNISGNTVEDLSPLEDLVGLETLVVGSEAAQRNAAAFNLRAVTLIDR